MSPAKQTRLNQLGVLYDLAFGRLEESAKFFRQAADKNADLRNVLNEGKTRENLARVLRKLGRLDEARKEIRRAIACKEQCGPRGDTVDGVGGALPTSRGMLEMLRPPLRPGARPSTATSLTDAMVERIVPPLAAWPLA